MSGVTARPLRTYTRLSMSVLRWLPRIENFPKLRSLFLLTTLLSFLFLLKSMTILRSYCVAGTHSQARVYESFPSRLLSLLRALENGLLDREAGIEQINILVENQRREEERARKDFPPNCRQLQLENVASLFPAFKPAFDPFKWINNDTFHDLLAQPPPFGFKGVESDFRQLVPLRQTSDPWWRKTSKKPKNTSSPDHPSIEHLQNSQNKECNASRTCVVVGNSYRLLGSKLGPAIDAHDIVIRFNEAPASSKYAPDVGTKTSLRLFFPESAQLAAGEALVISEISSRLKELDLKIDLSDFSMFGDYLFTVHKPPDMKWLLSAQPGLDEDEVRAEFRKHRFWAWSTPYPSAVTSLWDRIHLLSPQLLRETQDVASLFGKPTSGLSAIVLALHECSHPVSIVGFSYSRNRLGLLHYYDWQLNWEMFNPRNNATHDILVERKFIEKLKRLGLAWDLMN